MHMTMYVPDRRSLMLIRARELFRRAKDFVLPEFLVPARPCACPQGSAYSAGNASSTPRSDPLVSNACLFDTGPAPRRGTPSRNLMDWKDSVEVLGPDEVRDEKKLQMDHVHAQQEVSAILNAKGAVHPYIAAEAAKMFNDERLVRKHLWHIVVGALAEDYAFMPGETLQDISTSPDKVHDGLARFRRESGAHSSGVFAPLLRFISSIINMFKKDDYGNPVERPYWAHFLKTYGQSAPHGLILLDGGLAFQSSGDRLVKYWQLAVDYYSKGDTPRAFCALGHAVHLMQDLYVPAHVHNDPHGPTIFLGKDDSFEKWTARGDWPSFTRGTGDLNATIWDSRPLTRPVPDSTWNKDTVADKLAEFVKSIADQTKKLRSVDYEGVGGNGLRGQNKTGALSDPECYEQGRILIPAAIVASAQLIINFVDYVKRNGEPVV